ncbi:ParM/StbA family protein [Gottfriedia sp. S16(2024)]|uniref:ParM/StbA family protein n=1 Tax=Gottfriedia sp. S16(2024) TaxID=3162883 RepID=UPI003D21DA2B
MDNFIGIDAGNDGTKVAYDGGVFSFPSCIGEARDRKLENKHGAYDLDVVFRNKRYFMGTLAKYESDMIRQTGGLSKVKEETLLRVLTALFLAYKTDYSEIISVNVVVGQPIKMHTPDEKSKLRHIIEGTHSIKVNGAEKTFHIAKCSVAAEGASAYFSLQFYEEIVRIIDIGSGTVNFATIRENRFIDRDSNTLNFGTEKTNDHEALAKAIVAFVDNRWNKKDKIYIVGGSHEKFAELLCDELNINILKPASLSAGELSPIYANAIGFYRICKKIGR